MRRESNGMLFLAAAIFALAFLLRLLPISIYHSWDESIYLQHAERMYSGKDNYDELGIRPPLLPLIIAAGFHLWHSPIMASFLVALISAAMAPAAYFAARRLHSAEAGLAAALLVAVHPLFVKYSHLILTDALVASLLMIALVFILGKKWWEFLLAGIFSGLSGLMKFTGFGAAGIMALFVLYHDIQARRWQRSAAYVGGVLLMLLPYLLGVRIGYGSFTKVFRSAEAIVNVVQGSATDYVSLSLLSLPLLVGLLLFAVQYRNLRKYRLAPLVLLTALWYIGIVAYLLKFPNRELRYGLILLVPVFLLAGIGYAQLQRTWKYALPVCAAIIILLSASSFERLSEPEVNTWRSPTVQIAQRLDAKGNSSMPLYVTSEYPVWGYYTNNTIIVVDGPQFLNAYPRIMPRNGYLVVYKHSTREPTLAWADQQPELMRFLENDDIVIYHYRAPRRT
jgi:4-amino-4-deoxy-L-arabinose transferase-like glycosyltransferase